MKMKKTSFAEVYEGHKANFGMVSEVLNWLAGREKLSRSELQVLIVLFTMKRSGKDPYPSANTLAARCGGVEPRTIRSALKRLRDLGWLNTKQRGLNGSNFYDLSPLIKVLNESQAAFEEAIKGSGGKVDAEEPENDSESEPEPAPAPVVEPPKAQAKLPQVEAVPQVNAESLDTQEAEINARLEEIRANKPRKDPEGWEPYHWQNAHGLTLPHRMVYDKDENDKYVWSVAELEALVTALAARPDWKVSPNATQEAQEKAIRELIKGIVPESAPEAAPTLIDVQKHYRKLEPADSFGHTLNGVTVNFQIDKAAWLAFVASGGLELPLPTFKTKAEMMEWVVGIAYGKPAETKSAPVNVEPEIDPDDIIADYKARAA